jgi:hypothetical protein
MHGPGLRDEAAHHSPQGRRSERDRNGGRQQPLTQPSGALGSAHSHTDSRALDVAWQRARHDDDNVVAVLGDEGPQAAREVCVLEDGTAYHPDRLTDIFEWEAFMAGLPPIRFHDLRHSAASIAHAAGASMKDIQALLRHSSLTITADLYTSVFEDLAAGLAEQMARAVPRQRAAGDWRPTDEPTMSPLSGPDPRESPSWP